MVLDLAPRPSSSPARQLNRAQKAAAILIAVGPELAAGVLKELNDVEVESLALEVATLGNLAPEVLEAVLGEFQQEAVAHSHLLSGGEEHARAMLRQWKGDEGDEIIDRLLASVTTTPFHFLRMHEPTSLVQHLRDEHPQTIALILAHLPAKFAASVLSGFEPAQQAEVAVRVAAMGPTAPEVLRRVEAALQARLGEAKRGMRSDHSGVKELAAMLNNSDRGTERAILSALEVTDPKLAETIRSLMFVFEDLVTLDDRAVQEVLRSVDIQSLGLALKGVRTDVKECVMRNLSERALQSLTEEIELLGPVRVADVEAAQVEIVRQVRILEEAGSIVVARAGEGDVLE
jgi:flagellar motor switch protein FliG